MKQPRRQDHFATKITRKNAWAAAAFLRCLFGCFCGCLCFSVDARSEGQLDLKKALELTLERSPDYQNASLAARNADLSLKNAKSSLLPELNLELSHLYSRGGTGLLSLGESAQSPWSNSLGLTLSENLYDNGETLRKIDISTLARTAAVITYEQKKNSLLLDVLNSYLDYSQAVGVLKLQKEKLATLQPQSRSIENRYLQGLTSNRDYLRSKAEVQHEELAYQQQVFAVDAARSSLRTAIGTNEQMEFAPYQPSLKTITNLDFPKTQPEDSFEFKLALLQEKTADLDFRGVERNYYPRLSLRGNYSYNLPQYIGSRDQSGTPYWNAQAMLVLDYNLWDWEIRKRNVDIARNNQSIQKNSQQMIRIKVTQTLLTLQARIKLLQQTFKSNQEILKLDEDAFLSLQRAYRDGKVTYLDLITSLNALYSSRNELLSLEFDLLKAQANLASYQGRVYETVQGY